MAYASGDGLDTTTPPPFIRSSTTPSTITALATTGGGCILLDKAFRPSAIGLEDIFLIPAMLPRARPLVDQLQTRHAC